MNHPLTVRSVGNLGGPVEAKHLFIFLQKVKISFTSFEMLLNSLKQFYRPRVFKNESQTKQCWLNYLLFEFTAVQDIWILLGPQ